MQTKCADIRLASMQCRSSCDSTVPQLCSGRCYSSAGAQHCASNCGGGLCLNGGACEFSQTGANRCQLSSSKCFSL